MHVVLVANYEPDKQESMLRYAEMIATGLKARGVGTTVLRPPVIFGRIKSGAHGLGKWLGYVDKFVIFPFTLRWQARRIPQAVVHVCDHSNAMYTGSLKRIPHVVTCHDLLAVRSALGHFPQNPVGWPGRILQRWIVKGLRQSAQVVCDSNATRSDLMNLGGIVSAATTTLHIGLNYPYRPYDERDARALLRTVPGMGECARGFIFHIGGNQWYKNRAGVLRIYFEYVRSGGRLPLAMAGKTPPEDLKRLLLDKPEGATVILIGNVSNEVLNALYCRAACLLFPSLYEGFGWPVLEAMASGCRVVCSQRASLPEVGGEVAVYINPDDEKEAAERLGGLLSESSGEAAQRIEQGFRQAAKFSNEGMLDKLMDLYKKQLNGRNVIQTPGAPTPLLAV